MKLSYPDSDLVWLGMDLNGSIGAFITAGISANGMRVSHKGALMLMSKCGGQRPGRAYSERKNSA
jgi:hypothetical protein